VVSGVTTISGHDERKSIMLLSTVAAGGNSLFESDMGTLGRQYAEKYAAAEPFPHIVLDNFLPADSLELCLREFPTRDKAQIGYDRSQEKRKFEYKPEVLSPGVRSLFYSFNSLPFIAFLQNVTGIRGLIPDPYFLGAGLHEVLPGGYLNVHTDFMDAEQQKKDLLQMNEMAGGVIFKMKHDPRVTRIGKLLRRLSIDEIPQLFNVLRGEMSLVGPRPPLPAEVNLYSLAERGRLDVVPGITCIWQVSGRSEIPFDKQVELDLAYIDSQSIWGDIKLLMRTLPTVLRGRGAY
jgi:hypothetical protein